MSLKTTGLQDPGRGDNDNNETNLSLVMLLPEFDIDTPPSPKAPRPRESVPAQTQPRDETTSMEVDAPQPAPMEELDTPALLSTRASLGNNGSEPERALAALEREIVLMDLEFEGSCHQAASKPEEFPLLPDHMLLPEHDLDSPPTQQNRKNNPAPKPAPTPPQTQRPTPTVPQTGERQKKAPIPAPKPAPLQVQLPAPAAPMAKPGWMPTSITPKPPTVPLAAPPQKEIPTPAPASTVPQVVSKQNQPPTPAAAPLEVQPSAPALPVASGTQMVGSVPTTTVPQAGSLQKEVPATAASPLQVQPAATVLAPPGLRKEVATVPMDTDSLHSSMPIEVSAPVPAPKPAPAPAPVEPVPQPGGSNRNMASRPERAPEPVQLEGMEFRGRPRRQSAQKAVQQLQHKSNTKPETKRKRATQQKPRRTATPKKTGPFKPIRNYYHSTSFLKIKDHEWETNWDSDDDEENKTWLEKVERSLVHDFIDFTEAEKEFINLWNDFARSDTIIPPKRIPQMCLDFVEENYKKIRDKGLEEELPCHFINLWDEGLISADHLSFCIDHYHKLVGSPPLDA